MQLLAPPCGVSCPRCRLPCPLCRTLAPCAVLRAAPRCRAHYGHGTPATSGLSTICLQGVPSRAMIPSRGSRLPLSRLYTCIDQNQPSLPPLTPGCREGNDPGQERTVTYQEMLDLVCQVSAMQWFALASISLAARLCSSRLHFGAAHTASWAPGSKCTASRRALESKREECTAQVLQVAACQIGGTHAETPGQGVSCPTPWRQPWWGAAEVHVCHPATMLSFKIAPLPIGWPCRLATTCAARGWGRTMRWRSTCL